MHPISKEVDNDLAEIRVMLKYNIPTEKMEELREAANERFFSHLSLEELYLRYIK